MRMMLMLLMLMECGYDESGYQSVVILQVLIWLIGSIFWMVRFRGVFPPDHWLGECGCNERGCSACIQGGYSMKDVAMPFTMLAGC